MSIGSWLDELLGNPPTQSAQAAPAAVSSALSLVAPNQIAQTANASAAQSSPSVTVNNAPQSFSDMAALYKQYADAQNAQAPLASQRGGLLGGLYGYLTGTTKAALESKAALEAPEAWQAYSQNRNAAQSGSLNVTNAIANQQAQAGAAGAPLTIDPNNITASIPGITQALQKVLGPQGTAPSVPAAGAQTPAPSQQGPVDYSQGAPARYHAALPIVESSGNPNAVSSAGAQGLNQVMPATSADPGFGVKPWDGTQADLPRVGNDYLDAMFKHFKSPGLALAAYNMGPGAVQNWIQKTGGDPTQLPQETQQYLQKFDATMKAQGTPHGAANPPAMQAPGQDPQSSVEGMLAQRRALMLRQAQAQTMMGNPAAAQMYLNGSRQGLPEGVVPAPQSGMPVQATNAQPVTGSNQQYAAQGFGLNAAAAAAGTASQLPSTSLRRQARRSCRLRRR